LLSSPVHFRFVLPEYFRVLDIGVVRDASWTAGTR